MVYNRPTYEEYLLMKTYFSSFFIIFYERQNIFSFSKKQCCGTSSNHMNDKALNLMVDGTERIRIFYRFHKIPLVVQMRSRNDL